MKFFTKSFFLLLIIPALLVGPYFSFLSYKNTKADILIIETGDSVYKTLENIFPLSVFDKYFLRLHFNIENIKDIKAGEYLIINKTIEEIIEDISNGNYLRRSIRIKEGSNLYDLEKDLSNHYLINAKETFKSLLDKYPDTDFAIDAKFKIDLIDEIEQTFKFNNLPKFKSSEWLEDFGAKLTIDNLCLSLATNLLSKICEAIFEHKVVFPAPVGPFTKIISELEI